MPFVVCGLWNCIMEEMRKWRSHLLCKHSKDHSLLSEKSKGGRARILHFLFRSGTQGMSVFRKWNILNKYVAFRAMLSLYGNVYIIAFSRTEFPNSRPFCIESAIYLFMTFQRDKWCLLFGVPITKQVQRKIF